MEMLLGATMLGGVVSAVTVPGNVMGRTVSDVRGDNESANEKAIRSVFPSGG